MDTNLMRDVADFIHGIIVDYENKSELTREEIIRQHWAVTLEERLMDAGIVYSTAPKDGE